MAQGELPRLEFFEVTFSNLSCDRKYSDWLFVVFRFVQAI